MDPHKRPEKKRDPGKTIEVLFKISEAVSKSRNLDELYKIIHKNLDEILNVENFFIALHHKKKDVVTFPYHVDEKDTNPAKIENFSRRPTSTGMVIKEKKPMIFYEQDFIRMAEASSEKLIGTISKVWLGAPLMVGRKVKGVIAIQSYHSLDAYQKEDLNLLNSVSQHIALAIERKESEEAISQQGIVLEKILESSPVGIALVRNRVFKWVNHEMVRMFGYTSKADLEGQSTRIIYVNDSDFQMMGQTIDGSLAQEAAADFEIELQKKDGTRFPAHLQVNGDDDKDLEGSSIATITDLSRRRQAEREKIEKERLQGVLEMAGAVSHEINQPLQAILGYSELLILDADINEKSREYLDSIRSQASRLGKITQKLSGITRYRTMAYPGNTRIVDIWKASDDVAESDD